LKQSEAKFIDTFKIQTPVNKANHNQLLGRSISLAAKTSKVLLYLEGFSGGMYSILRNEDVT
jgi:hypothetical protein